MQNLPPTRRRILASKEVARILANDRPFRLLVNCGIGRSSGRRGRSRPLHPFFDSAATATQAARSHSLAT